jgi:hypothetical protein
MATTSQTTYTHTCDLCGQERDETELRQLYDSQSFGNRVAKKADVCQVCTAKPVGDVLDFLSSLREASLQGSLR